MAAPTDISAGRPRTDRATKFPYSLEAEASVIGGVLISNECLALIDDLEPGDFFDIRNRIVFAAMRKLQTEQRPIDIVTLEDEIVRAEKLEAIGGVAYLGECALRVPTIDNVVEYKNTIKLHSINRRVLVGIASVAERAKNWPHDNRELLDELLGDLERIKADAGIGDVVSRKTTYGEPFRQWLGDTEPSNDPSEIFDAHGLIVRGEPGLWLGDPKVGKTLLVTDLALHLAAGRKEWCGVPLYRRCRVLLLLREDSERTTKRRVFQMARGAKIDLWELEKHLEVDGITPLYFDDPKHLAQLRRQLKQFDIVIIDSLSTIHNGDENSVESMAPVMNQWRDMSLTTKTGLPIIHHFRKQNGDYTRSSGTGGVLQRARGSSIIGATTRHAVGISKGPEKHQVVIELESNHDIESEPFVVERVSGITARGEYFLTHKRVGSLRDARLESESSIIDPIVLRVVKAGGVDGIGPRDLRDIVNHELTLAHGQGVSGSKVDQAARRLATQGQLEQLKMSKKWRSSIAIERSTPDTRFPNDD